MKNETVKRANLDLGFETKKMDIAQSLIYSVPGLNK